MIRSRSSCPMPLSNSTSSSSAVFGCSSVTVAVWSSVTSGLLGEIRELGHFERAPNEVDPARLVAQQDRPVPLDTGSTYKLLDQPGRAGRDRVADLLRQGVRQPARLRE